MFPIIAMYGISASTFMLGKQLLVYASPLVIVGIRTLSAGLLFLAYCYGTRKKIDVKQLFIPCTIIALCSFYLSNTLKFWSLTYLSTTTAACIALTEPLWAVVMASYMLSERVSLQRFFALALCIGSGFIVANNGLQLNVRYADFFAVPACMLFVAVGASACGALLMRKLIVHNHVQPAVVNGMSMLIAGVLALGHSFVDSSCGFTTNLLCTPFVVSMAVMVLLSNIIAYSLYGYAVKRYSVLLISCGSFVRPLCVAWYEWLFLHKAVAWHVPYAAMLLCSGLLMLYAGERQAEHEQKCA